MTRVITTVGAALVTLGLTCTACVSDRPHPVAPGQSISGSCRLPIGSGVVGSVGAIVAIREFRFVPQTIRVPAGTTITWINCDDDVASEPHTTTADDDAWTSDLLSSGAMYARRFDEPGVFAYHCAPHPFMTAMVIVE